MTSKPTTIAAPWDDRLTDEDAGRHLKNTIGLARKQAGIPDGEGHVTIHVTITSEE